MTEANAHYKAIKAWDEDVRLDLAAIEGGGKLTNEEIGRVNPGPPAYILRLMEFLRDRRWSVFGRGLGNQEIHDELPVIAAREAHRTAEVMSAGGAALEFVGPGYFYNRNRCRFESGCVARLSANVATTGRATIGILVSRPDGTEKSNLNVLIAADGNSSTPVVRARADAGELLDPYAFAWDASVLVKVRTFNFVMVPASGP